MSLYSILFFFSLLFFSFIESSDFSFEQLHQKLKTEADAGIALETDGWTAISKQGHITIGGHYITSDFRLQSVCLDYIHLSGSHNGPTIGKCVEVDFFFSFHNTIYLIRFLYCLFFRMLLRLMSSQLFL